MTSNDRLKGLKFIGPKKGGGKLNLENAIQEGRERVQGHPGHSLKVSHMIEIADNHDQDLFHCMGDVFFLGVRQGYRIAQKERKTHDK